MRKLHRIETEKDVIYLNREPLSADPRQVDAALRAQLNDAAAASQLLMRRCESEKDMEYLEIICRAVFRAERILENRELARRLEDEDELRAVFGTMDLVAWCRELTNRAAELLKTMGLTLSFHTELTSLLTMGDAFLLDQMMYELLSNAVKMSPEGGRLSATLAAGTQNMAIITVGNEGVGLPEQMLRRLEEDSDELSGPDLTPQAGAGFGLRLARVIVGIHGGLMMLESAADAGVRVAVSLPLREGRRNRLESPRPDLDGYDRALVALSDVLPPEAFRSGKSGA